MKELRLARTIRGQSLVESMIVLPMFALLMFGIIEIAYVLHVKTTLNAATFDAARKGSLNNARLVSMQEGLASTLAALFVRSNPSDQKTAEAYATVLGLLKIRNTPRGFITIISPSRAVFNEFQQSQKLKLDGRRERSTRVIPNDNLMWRDSSAKRIGSGTNAVRVNVQDANLLKIRATWCHKLVVPFLDRFIHWTYSRTSTSMVEQQPSQLLCDGYARDVARGGFYIPVQSSAIVRMQSPVLGNDLR